MLQEPYPNDIFPEGFKWCLSSDRSDSTKDVFLSLLSYLFLSYIILCFNLALENGHNPHEVREGEEESDEEEIEKESDEESNENENEEDSDEESGNEESEKETDEQVRFSEKESSQHGKKRRGDDESDENEEPCSNSGNGNIKEERVNEGIGVIGDVHEEVDTDNRKG